MLYLLMAGHSWNPISLPCQDAVNRLTDMWNIRCMWSGLPPAELALDLVLLDGGLGVSEDGATMNCA